MSFVKKEAATPVNSEFKLELVPNPAKKFSPQVSQQQNAAITKLTRASKGLFLPNPAVTVNGAVKSGQLYNRGLSVKNLTNAMQHHDLVLRVSVHGEHNACAMATHSDILSNAMISSPSGSFSLGIAGNSIRHIDFI